MRVLAFNQFYAPDYSATSQLLTDLCEDLVRAGDEVTVVASPGKYQGGAKLPARELLNGVEVVRPWASGMGKVRRWHRLADYGSFWLSATARAARERRPDVVLALSTPPLIATGAALVATARRLPLVYWVQDVYPELAVELGVLGPGSPAARALAAIAAATYRQCDRVVAISDCMADRLLRAGAPAHRIAVIPNWADGASLAPGDRKTNPFRIRHDLQGKFVAMYSGNLGAVHELATIVEAARRSAASAPDVVFLFVGDGVRRRETEELASGLANVRFLPYQPRESLRESLSAADVHLVTLKSGLEGLVVPSKFYGALACGRPVCFVGPASSDVAQAIRDQRLGWCGEPGDSAGLAGAIAALAMQGGEDAHRIRDVFMRRYDRSVATRRWRALLCATVGDPALRSAVSPS